ncbi:MAG: peptidase BlaR1 [Acidobacteriaceae bacterium]|nr:peptidase BlaR1 [Acidobacteriaceae bacterium]
MNGTLEALAWTLIHFCWQATVILGLYALVDLCLKKARSQTRYLVALTVLSLMFVVFMVTLGYEAIHSPAAPGLSLDSPLRPSGINLSLNTIVSKMASPNSTSAGFRWSALLPWLDGVWLMGVIGLSIRSFRGWLWLQRLRRVTIERAPKAIQASFEKTCARLGMKRLPELRMSQIVSSPMTIGVLRTLVLLPTSALLALSPEQLEAVFAHELAHVRRADYFWNLVQTLAETLFFFHPAVWWLGKRLREQRELCCDDIAVETCNDPLVYATALFRLEGQRTTGNNLAMALDGHQSGIPFRARILRILGEASPQSHAAQLRPVSLLAVFLSLFIFLSPAPKALGAVAQKVPVKQILAVPSEIARVAHDALPSKRAQRPDIQTANRPAAQGNGKDTKAESGAPTYEEQMRAAGYDLDEGRYIVLRDAGITPAYAQEMATLGFGKPAVGTLLQLKKQDITKQYLEAVNAAGLKPRGFDALVSYRIFNMSPEFIAGIRAAGFESVSSGQLQNLRAVGVTPEEAKALKLRLPHATVQDLILSHADNHQNEASSAVDDRSPQPPRYQNPPIPIPPPHRPRSSGTPPSD